MGGHCRPKILPGPPQNFSGLFLKVLHRRLTAPLVGKLAPPVPPPNENVWLRPWAQTMFSWYVVSAERLSSSRSSFHCVCYHITKTSFLIIFLPTKQLQHCVVSTPSLKQKESYQHIISQIFNNVTFFRRKDAGNDFENLKIGFTLGCVKLPEIKPLYEKKVQSSKMIRHVLEWNSTRSSAKV